MATKQLANLTVHKLTVQPLVGDTVLTWDSVAGWPTVGDFPIRIDHPSNGTFEYVLCTAVNVGLLQTTVTRAQEGTSASAGFIVGSTGANALTKATMDAAFVRLDTALSQTLTGPLVVPTTLGGSAAATSYGSMPLKAAETLLVGIVGSISWTSIPSTFRHAIPSWYARSDGAVAATNLMCRVNNDSAANYDYQVIRGVGATAVSGEALAATQMVLGAVPGSTATANYFGTGSARFHHYAGTTGNKLANAVSAYATANTTGTMDAESYGAKWRTTATAINRIDLLPLLGNFIAGSYFSLWLEP